MLGEQLKRPEYHKAFAARGSIVPCARISSEAARHIPMLSFAGNNLCHYPPHRCGDLVLFTQLLQGDWVGCLCLGQRLSVTQQVHEGQAHLILQPTAHRKKRNVHQHAMFTNTLCS